MIYSIQKRRLKQLILVSFLLFSGMAQSQILVTLIFGEKLNSEGVEFGLSGGLTRSRINGFSDQRAQTTLNLGFYFDSRLKGQWWLNTGVMVVSRQGTNRISGDELAYFYQDTTIDIDPIVSDGNFGQAMDYFNVPILIKYKHPTHFFVEGGFMLGLRTRAGTYYKASAEKASMEFVYYNQDLFRRIDAGAMFGLGYKLMKGEGMNIGVRYYHGLVDIYKSDETSLYNQTLYFFADIPIGANKEQTAD